ncbi:MAG: serine hydrolase [Pirellulaceae bacterium]
MRISTSLLGIVLLLLFTGAGRTEESPTSQPAAARLVQAAVRGDRDLLVQMLDEGVDVNATHEGYTAWAAAKRSGYLELAEYLESRGAKTDIPLPSLNDFVDQRLASNFGETTPACAVLVARDGKIILQRVVGMADIEKSQPASEQTKFRIGSVTKQFTAAAVLKLQESGKLSVQDPLAKFLPDYPNGQNITLHHLLTHTSGIQSYTSKPDFMQTVTEPTSEEALIDSFKNDSPEFAPGERYSYCNSGYFLLGHIVGKVSGRSFEAYLSEQFFQPLGMTNTGIHATDKSLSHEATGYSIEDGRPVAAINWDMSRAGGAGAIYSTLEDLFKWNEAIFSGKVLSQASLDAAWKPTQLNDGTTSDYGYGWMVGRHRGLKTIEHSGGLQGFLSNLVRYPEQNVTIVAFTNVFPNGDLPAPNSVCERLGETLLWEQMESRTVRMVDATVDASSFPDYVGRYDYGSGVILEITLEDDQLHAQLTGQAKFPIYPQAQDQFFWKVVDAEVEFVRDEMGQVVSVIHTQNGHSQPHKRLPTLETIELTNEELDAFVGKYDYAAAVMTVTREGNQLMAQISGQDAYPIYPKEKNTFVWKVVEAAN